VLPNLGGIDISPVILILFLIFIRDVVLVGWILPAVTPPAEL
jgi:YggT family protein